MFVITVVIIIISPPNYVSKTCDMPNAGMPNKLTDRHEYVLKISLYNQLNLLHRHTQVIKNKTYNKTGLEKASIEA